MMHATVSLLFIYFSGRLFFYDVNYIITAKKASKKSIAARVAWGFLLLLLCFRIKTFLVLFVFHAALILFDSYVKNWRPKHGMRYYLLHLLIALIVLPWTANYLLTGFHWQAGNPLVITAWLLPSLDGSAIDRFLLIATGYVFTLLDGTIFIRLVLNRLRAFPRQSAQEGRKDKREYELGRVIGYLERTFLFFLIIWDQIGAIAILIALKSLARFKELDNKDFAEYFLVGSLLSLLAAVVPAVLVRLILD